MEYKLNVNITTEDFKAFNFDYIFRKNKLYVFMFVVLFIPFFLILGTEILTFKNWARFISNILPLIILLILYIFYFTVFFPKKLKKIYNSDKLMQENQELTLTETGITEKTSRSFCNYYLDDIRKVIIGKKVISIYIAAYKALVIPRHCFSSKDEGTKIEEFIKTYYMKKK